MIDYASNPEKTENIDFSHPDFRGLRDVLDYAQQDKKTEKQFFVSGINCDPAMACIQMSQTKLQYQKAEGILAFHGYQAFAPREATPEIAHTIGVKLAQELWGDRFEVVVSTHLDKQHLHNHFVLNSVSFVDGKRYYDNNATYALMRKTSDRLCREYALSVIENPRHGKSKHYAEWRAEQDGKSTWRGLIREDVDRAIVEAMTFTQFIAALQRQGYEVKTGVKHMAVRPLGKERYIRLRSLGEEYTEDVIRQRILRNHVPRRPQPYPKPRRSRGYVKGSIKGTKKRTGLQALYLHYLYKMGILPRRNRASPKRTHFLLREDIRHLNEIIAQTKLLCAHGISSKEQLLSYQSDLEVRMKSLTDARKSVYHRLRRCTEDGQTEDFKRQIAELSGQIRALREEVKLCAGILSRSDAMKERLHRVNQEEKEQRKEEHTHEQQRRGGSGRQHEPQRH